MSVIIRDMEMPKCCRDCYFFCYHGVLASYHECDVSEKHIKGDYYNSRRASWCPLIDTNEVVEHLEKIMVK